MSVAFSSEILTGAAEQVRKESRVFPVFSETITDYNPVVPLKGVTYWAIKETATGKYLPIPYRNHSRGGANLEPADIAEKHPRLFPSEVAAKKALSQWLRGRYEMSYYDDTFRGSHEQEISLVPVDSRKRKNMEIVPIFVVLA